MAKRWASKEDKFVVEFFECVGAMIGPHDLGRSEASVKARAKSLKASGAWEAYKTAAHHLLRAQVLAGHTQSDVFDVTPAEPSPSMKSVN